MHVRRVHVVVHGIVQGVGFRYYTEQQAFSYQIKGWVRNVPDGTVEIDAEGNERNVERFLEAVKRGSRQASVSKIEVSDIAEAGAHDSFRIRR
ncbi:MAG TPA: acylphosphatase [Bacillales bacterium]|nr:acylphosphatase [Bacillales bacterium]